MQQSTLRQILERESERFRENEVNNDFQAII